MRVKFRSISGFFWFLLLSNSSFGADFQGRVVKVVDGDTLWVLKEKKREKVRLAGIDAPENRQPFGQAAKKRLLALSSAKVVEVIWNKRDRFGRVLGKVIVAGKDVGLTLIEDGLAWHYKQFQADQDPGDRKAYSKAEELARANKVGLWNEPSKTPPWEFRKRRK